jgi:guanylate kinase
MLEDDFKTDKMIIVAGPSGVGKSSFVDKIIGELPILVDIKTYTTRPMRVGESEGDPYHFVTLEKFDELIEQGFFVEWANVHTSKYGAPYDQIYNAWRKGHPVIMDVDVQGTATFKKNFPTCCAIFIHPPSIDALRKRVMHRDKGNIMDLEVRMANAQKEIQQAYLFNYQLVNDEFDESYSQFKKTVEAYIKPV